MYRLAETAASDIPEKEGIVALQSGKWLISHGSQLVLLETFQHLESGRWIASVIKRWYSDVAESSSFPRIVSARFSESPDVVHVVLQRTIRMETKSHARPGVGSTSASASAKTHSTSQVSFELVTGQVNLQQKDDLERLEIEYSYNIQEAPYDIIVDSEGTVIVIAEHQVQSKAPPELPPKKKLKENQNALTESGDNQEEKHKEHKDNLAPTASQVPAVHRVAPFVWRQTSDTVTITFNLPLELRKNDIQCVFHPSTVDLGLSLSTPLAEAKIEEISEDTSEPVSLVGNKESSEDDLRSGRYRSRPFWSDIDPIASTWTWETSEKEKANLLTLHLEKKHAGTRWVSAFRQKGTVQTIMEAEDEAGSDEDGAELEDVPETLDPADISSILEGVEKYTEAEDSTVQSRGFGERMPGILQDSLEEEDATVGRSCLVSKLSQGNVHVLGGTQTLLAQSLPSADSQQQKGFVLRRDLDGVFFSASNTAHFSHSDTFPALSYVLASKRDTNHVYVHKSRGSPRCVLAFESGSKDSIRGSGAGNLFVYYSPKTLDATSGHAIADNGRSRVVRLGCSEKEASGFFVGTAAVSFSEKQVLLVLCQRQLLVLHNVL